MKATVRLFQLVLPLCLALPVLGEARLYRWVDEHGNVHYSDHVPPEHAHQGRDVKSSDGRTLDRVAPARSREEIEAEKRQQQAEAETRRRLEEEAARQAEHDRVLRLTFSSVRDIERIRDDRIEALRGRIHLAEGRIVNLEGQLNQARQRAADLERSGRDADDAHERIQVLRARIEENQVFIATTEAEIATTEARYEADIERFQYLLRREAAER
ncbi:hypothetical protein CAI21_07485 [Alkalilimnicola ehrlichii]|uniref:DUF4124 domain-containing protein n=1 Tax=Alkalilimnicola ehrlichii TaxID=351052 RepID=A0A3E0WYB6_9GAMM|nr:DUF4124 domain-containing protein [Alkalilimnicola ehrlichii]RFA30047.1 hypothetical protein CAI21_07485 [Alkalilimnicola ehrlichii]RFA37389.1 hypothetical protein CAL65_08815 [Alkalilimnicola ehrlichii]